MFIVCGLGRYLLVKRDASARPRGLVRLAAGTAFRTTLAAWGGGVGCAALAAAARAAGCAPCLSACGSGGIGCCAGAWWDSAAYSAQRLIG